MTLARFAELAAAYGADLRRWPETERQVARAMAADPKGAVLLAREDALDALLDGWDGPTPTPELRARLLGSMPARSPSSPGRAWTWATAGGLAAACAAGLALGVWMGPTPRLDEGATVSALLAPYDPASDGGIVG